MVVGGFLGSGKTTSILGLAKLLLARGRKVGIVTNDQGSSLVDTAFLAREGLPVLEVTGGCFCCNFNELTAKIEELAESQMPDLVLAEPVGSCTDLIATIFRPMDAEYAAAYNLYPLSVLADPRRVRKFMLKSESSAFPDEINYLFEKQLQEADIIVLNKIDALSPDDVDRLTAFLKERFKNARVLAISAKEGLGLEDWLSAAEGSLPGFKTLKDIDYDRYAAAEALLGWMNGTARLEWDGPGDVNSFIRAFLEELREDFKFRGNEIAHLKVYAIGEEDWAKAGVTDINGQVEFSREFGNRTPRVNIIINLRVAAEPDLLEKAVKEALEKASSREGVKAENFRMECFKPGRPNPVYRYAD